MNAQLLEQAGFIAKMMAGVYAYLPLGFRVLQKIETIIREEMNAIGGQEVFLPALQAKDLWQKTGRWDGLREVMYQFRDHSNREIGLGVTHEEVVAEIVRRNVASYKDLPFAMYQIQTKFRHELRAKSGLTRGREFAMKDLYSCHATPADCNAYYETVKAAYTRCFQRLGLTTIIVEASGGSFSKDFSHEFQVLTAAGEDTIFHCDSCGFAQNKEISGVTTGNHCPSCGTGTISESRAIEVGNIFKLGTTFSDAIGARFRDRDGKEQPVVMASYGIGPSRVMGTIIEVHHDDRGMIWPEAVAPFAVHVLSIGKGAEIMIRAEHLAERLMKDGIDVLLDDRRSLTAGERFHDADLLGIPHRVIVSERNEDKYEYRTRSETASVLVTEQQLLKRFHRGGRSSTNEGATTV